MWYVVCDVCGVGNALCGLCGGVVSVMWCLVLGGGCDVSTVWCVVQCVVCAVCAVCVV